MSRTVPPSLVEGDLPEFWGDVSARLERNGSDWRGTVRISGYSPTTARVLTTLVGRPGRRTITLTELESELVRLDIGTDLASVLAALGHPVSSEPAARRAERFRVAQGRDAARIEAATWPEPWSAAWVEELVSAGLLARLGPEESTALLHGVRRVLDAIDDLGGHTFSRADLAAAVVGSAHGLDDGTLLERATARALVHRQGDTDLARSDPWSAIGGHRSLVAGAALTWRLPIVATHPLAGVVQASDDLRIPYLVTRLALESVPLEFTPESDVLVVENPRVLEHAAQTGARRPMVCANGNPSSTVTALIDALIESGATVRYHGDFDAAGIDICARLHARGLVPWQMSAADYLAALDDAAAARVLLPTDPKQCGPTPWDGELRKVFNRRRRVVQEERILHRLVPTQPS